MLNALYKLGAKVREMPMPSEVDGKIIRCKNRGDVEKEVLS